MEEMNLKIKSKVTNIKFYIGDRIFKNISNLLDKHKVDEVFVLSNDTIWNLWGKQIEAVLAKKRLKAIELIPDGERYKNIDTVSNIYNSLVKHGATRKTALLAVGGGVIGDLGGFVASTYHRGIPLVHVPTTLLSQVDSSVGGKTGYNLVSGKNLVGTFYQPLFTLIDIDFLTTLPEREYLSGLSEVIKAGLIRDKKLVNFLIINRDNILNRDSVALYNIISKAVQIKINVVAKDEKESGERAILNFGHTVAHALEKYKNWKILHGEAVAVGICFAAKISKLKGYIDDVKCKKIIDLINNYKLPTNISLSYERLSSLIYHDKKRRNKDVEWVLLKDIGNAIWSEKVDDFLLRQLTR